MSDPIFSGEIIGWSGQKVSISPRRPRWKGRVALGTFYVPPGTSFRISPLLTRGMRRVHIQRRVRKNGFVSEWWWGLPIAKRDNPKG